MCTYLTVEMYFETRIIILCTRDVFSFIEFIRPVVRAIEKNNSDLAPIPTPLAPASEKHIYLDIRFYKFFFLLRCIPLTFVTMMTIIYNILYIQRRVIIIFYTIYIVVSMPILLFG